MLVLIVGPSGAGKDTLLDAARATLDDDARFVFARRIITRRAGVGSEDHEAVDDATFDARLGAGGFALHWSAHGLRYAIGAEIGVDIAAGRVVVASVSRGAIADAAARFPVAVIEINAPADILASRLAARNREPADAIAARLARVVPLRMPDGVACTIVVNDGTVAEGAAKLVDALIRATPRAALEQTPPHSAPA